ncbi:MAG: hypothetical protein ABSH38_06405 [Verrucomicrobiota bacterium]|jgi:hypothetical protein
MDAAKADLMRALGRLARGLSTLFWCLPLTLVAQVETGRTDWVGFLGAFAFVPALVLSGLLWHGLRQLRDFQRQERVWQQALDRAEFLAIVNAGLSPFLFWWHRFPLVPLYIVCVDFLAVAGLLFLMQLNRVLLRLSAMLPDEMLRLETRTFTGLNIWMLLAVLAGFSAERILRGVLGAPRLLGAFPWGLQEAAVWLALFFALMPVAMTLALLWKIKEAIFTSLIETER